MASLMIVHNDENGTQASCGTVYGENDIGEYYVGLGTAEGKVSCICNLVSSSFKQFVHLTYKII